MKRRLIGVFMVMVLAALAFSAVAEDVCSVATRVMPEACVTQADLLIVLDQLFGNCGAGPATSAADVVTAFIAKGFLPEDFALDAEACVSKGFVSQILYRAFDIRPGLVNRVQMAIYGLTSGIACGIAQDNCLMVLGEHDELLNGRELAACIRALIKFSFTHEPLPCTTTSVVAHRAQLSTWLECLPMTSQEAAEYIPCLITVPTS